MIKKLVLTAVVVGMAATQAFSADEKFKEGEVYVTPMLGINSFSIPFGAGVEYGLNKNIGVGATLMVDRWGEDFGGVAYSNTIVTPAVRAAYHLTQLDIPKLDLYGGLALGYSIYSYSWDIDGSDVAGFGANSSGLSLTPFAGARYYFKPTIAFTGELHYSGVGDFSGAGAFVGVTFKMK